MGVALVEEDVAPGNRRLGEMPDERLLAQRQITKTVRVQLNHGGLANAFEQVFPSG